MTPTFHDVSWPIRTERLTLRPSTPADADATWAYRSDPAVAEWTTRLPTDRVTYEEWYSSPEWLETRVIIELDGELIGELHVEVGDAWTQEEVAEQGAGTEVELGWVLAPEHHGHGYAAEAVSAALGLCFEQLRVRRVTAECFADNEASWRLMERVGMRRESHTIKDSLHRDRGWLDSYLYAILAEEWRALRPS